MEINSDQQNIAHDIHKNYYLPFLHWLERENSWFKIKKIALPVY